MSTFLRRKPALDLGASADRPRTVPVVEIIARIRAEQEAASC
ncbi:hypothetical protein ACFWQG_13220 [Rhodococcus sp. NPDC058532]